MKLQTLIFSASMATMAAVSHALVLDDFTTGATSQIITSGAAGSSQSGSMIGGDRALVMFVEFNAFGLTYAVDLGSGALSVSSQSGVDGIMQIGYGYDWTGTVFLTDYMNLDLSDQSAFTLGVISRDGPTDVTIEVFSSSTGTFVGSTKSLTGTAVGVPQLLTFNFSEFVGANFSDIDQIVVTVDTSNSTDIAFSSLQAVPEPATMIALAAGAGALAFRKRRKS